MTDDCANDISTSQRRQTDDALDDWETFIVKDDRQRCPPGFHRNEETGQCVDANGNVYEEQPDTPGEQSQQSEEQPTDEEQSEEEQSEEEQSEGGEGTDDESEGEDEPLVDEDKPKPKKSIIDSINERSTQLRDWVTKNFGSFEKLGAHSSKSTVFLYTAVVFPILSLVKAIVGSSETLKKIQEKRKQKKELEDNIQITLNGFNAGLDKCCEAIGINSKELKNHKWTEKDVTRINEALDARLGELMESKAIKKLMADREAGLNPQETGSIYSAEYGELRAIMTVMKESNKHLDNYYNGCVKHKIKEIKENRETKRIAEERMKQLRGKRVKGNADANTLRHEYNPKSGYRIRGQ